MFGTARSPTRRLARLVVPFVSVVLALLLAELGLRVAAELSPRLDGLLYLPSLRTEFDDAETLPELLTRGYHGYHPLGSTRGFVLNSKGFRTHEYRPQKDPGTLRVLALGDSFTFDSSSVPLAEMWHQVLGREIAADLQQPVEVISLSQPAVGPRFELRLWELEGARLDPDLVVLGFFVGNDFTDESGVPLGAGPADRWAHRSALWRLVRNLLRRRQATAPAGLDPIDSAPDRMPSQAEGRATEGGYELPGYPATYDPATPTLPMDRFLAGEAERMRILSGPDSAAFSRLCADAVAVVERMARGVEAVGSRFVVLVIPDEAQVDAELRSRLFDPPLPLDVTRPQRCLEKELGQRRIEVVDLLPAFRVEREAHGTLLYKPRDTHWTSRGNRLAGQALAAELLRRGLVQPPG